MVLAAAQRSRPQRPLGSLAAGAPLSLNHAAKELPPAPAKQEDTPEGRNIFPWTSVDLLGYQRDFCERAILFWDTLRQRANNMLEHERAGLPPLLDFKSETLLDARRFDRPVNYALLRITEIGEQCWDDCVDIN